MKLFIFFITLCLFGFGCGQVQTISQPISTVSPSEKVEEKNQEVEKTAVDSGNNSVYEKWAIHDENILRVRKDDRLNWTDEERKQNKPKGFQAEFANYEQDCVALDSTQIGRGDLLSTMIVNDAFRNRLNLSVYNPAYLKKIEKQFAQFTQSTYKKDFFAYQLCHLDKNIDIASGDKGVLLLYNSTVVEMEMEGVRRFNQSVTGAEVYPCSVRKEKEFIIWSCSVGYNFSEGKYTHKDWQFDLSGKLIGVKEIEEKLE
jgi:hypothetical protein